MNIKRYLAVLTVGSVVLLSGLSTSAAYATDNPAPSAVSIASTLTPEMQAQIRADEPEIEKLAAAAVTFVEGEVHFDRAAAAAAGVSSRVINDYEMGLAIARGEESTSMDASFRAARAISAAACNGKNEQGIAAWGPYAQLDSCNTARLIGLLSSGAGAAGIAALITSATGISALAAGLVSGILGIGAGAVGICSADGNGVVLRVLWTGLPYCTGP